METSIMEEFRLRNFGLDSNRPDLFVSSQWGCPTLYMLWRVVWPLFHIAWIISSGVLNYQWATTEENRVKWFVYLTNWTYFMLTAETIIEAVVVVFVRLTRKDIVQGLNKRMPWYLKIVWCLYNISTTASFIVTGLYWSMIFKASKGVNPVSLAVHGLNSLYVILNLFVTALPVRVLHFYFPVLYGVVYTSFTAVYHSADGTNMKDEPYVYSILDWSKPEKTIIMVMLSTFVAIPVMHAIVYFLYFTRVCLQQKCKRSREKCRVEQSKQHGATSHKNDNATEKDFENGGFNDRSSVSGKLSEQDSKTNLITEKY